MKKEVKPVKVGKSISYFKYRTFSDIVIVKPE